MSHTHKVQLGKVYAGYYEAQVGDVTVTVYKQEIGGLWTAVLQGRNHGEDCSFYTKADCLEWVSDSIEEFTAEDAMEW